MAASATSRARGSHDARDDRRRCRRSILYPNCDRRPSARPRVRMPPGAGLRVSDSRRSSRAITPRTRMIFLNTPEQPDRPADPDRRSRGASRGAAPRRLVLSTRPTSSSAARSFLPRARQLPERARRAARSRRPTGSPACASASSSASRRRSTPCARVTLPFNLNVVAIAATLAALDDHEYLPRYAAAGRRVARAALCRLRRLGPRATGRAPPTSCWCGSATRSPLVVEALAARHVHVRDRSNEPG